MSPQHLEQKHDTLATLAVLGLAPAPGYQKILCINYWSQREGSEQYVLLRKDNSLPPEAPLSPAVSNISFSQVSLLFSLPQHPSVQAALCCSPPSSFSPGPLPSVVPPAAAPVLQQHQLSWRGRQSPCPSPQPASCLAPVPSLLFPFFCQRTLCPRSCHHLIAAGPSFE